ncbi:MAG: CRISPR locus-related DNA-binding protein [Candidatus Thermoplasmatota archaeon]|nr:CRISPR locus-related DNA-binding protein [Candidatus Thermoplasmatota archaeon]MBS3801992.1 CRISPR locus-related DNA-binding protein [Candidatus Thermoplasmatota archaeon]
MAKVLIATLYSPDPVLLASNRLGPDRLILLIDHKPNKKQLKNLDLIQNSLGRVVDIKTVKTAVYDIVEVATKAVELMDLQPQDDELFINITSGRKTKALGLLFAAYARKNRISKIAYNPEEDKKAVIWLPKLAFKLTESQKKLLDELVTEETKQMNYVDLAKQVGISKAMLYRNIDELKDLGYISVENGLQLTDAGKIARL